MIAWISNNHINIVKDENNNKELGALFNQLFGKEGNNQTHLNTDK